MTSMNRERHGVRETWLLARIHLDGFRANGRAYLKALWWRLLCKRVRSRSMIEPLIGTSPRAYSLWQARHGYAHRSVSDRPAQSVDRSDGLRFMIGLDLSAGQVGLTETRASLDGSGIQITQTCLGVPGLGPINAPPVPFWLCPLRAGDQLATGALEAYALAASQTDKTIIYADDDLVDPNGHRHTPHFKPDWNRELFRWHDFLSHSCIVRIDDLAELTALAGREDWLAALLEQRLAADPTDVVHLPHILHHRRVRPSPNAQSHGAAPYLH
jgi:hypothetical protein